MPRKKVKGTGITSNVKADVASSKSRTTREGLTRVGLVTAPIKGKNTQAKQWNRWTP